MKWVTRERPMIDRIACPWLIRRFIDPEAEFLYVPADQVKAVAEREKATPFDIAGVELGHVGPECSFDAFIHKYRLTDAALLDLAVIVRAGKPARRADHDIVGSIASVQGRAWVHRVSPWQQRSLGTDWSGRHHRSLPHPICFVLQLAGRRPGGTGQHGSRLPADQ